MKNSIFKRIPISLIVITLLAALFRIPMLDRIPPALYSDEAAQGYNAYSILKTGHDEHEVFLPVSLRSFGDWKPPATTYLMIPTIAIFGLNAWGVRLPSAILGTLTVLLTYYLTVEFLKNFTSINKSNYLNLNTEQVSLLSAFFLAISPWHILQSRSAMLVAISLFFLYVGILTFLKGIKNSKFWYLSSISFVIAIYSYYSMRIIVPLLLFYFVVRYRQTILSKIKIAIFSIILFGLLLLPLFWGFVKEPNVLFGRAKTVSVFYNKGVSLTVRDLIAQDGTHQLPKLSQFIHNRPYHYIIDIIRRFFHQFDGRFLFLSGDNHPPFQIPNMGILYFIDGVFLVLGVVYLIKYNTQLFRFIGYLATISILPAALTFLTPSSNRILTIIIPFTITISLGVLIISKVINKQLLFVGISALYLISFSYFAYQYFIILPKYHADWWHYGYKELYSHLKTQENKNETISVFTKPSVSYIFQLFYGQVDPKFVLDNIRRDYRDDEFGFEHVNTFGKHEFLRHFSWLEEKDKLPANSLLVVSEDEESEITLPKIYEILYPDERVAFKVYKVE